MGLYEFYSKVQYHKRKIVVDLGGYGTNSVRIRGKNKHFCSHSKPIQEIYPSAFPVYREQLVYVGQWSLALVLMLKQIY